MSDGITQRFGKPLATLAVLAGGEGRRMGGPKAHLRIGGRPILEYLLAKWNWPGPTLLVTSPGREHPPGAERFDEEATDPVAGEGPLRGILTGLARCQSPIGVFATVDMPGVDRAQFQWLVDQLAGRPDQLGILLSQRTDDRDHVQPFPCALRREAIDAVSAQLGSGASSVRALGQRPAIAVLAAPSDWPETVWTNLNHPQDLERFETER